MIGVIANLEEEELVREFFELFKTPWEWFREEGSYEVVLMTGERPGARDLTANLVVVYSGRQLTLDRDHGIPVGAHEHGGMLSHEGCELPIYGDLVTFQESAEGFLSEQQSRHSAGVLRRSGSHSLARIGYDLFRELKTLLSTGQPTENAHVPTVEIHVAILRNLMVEAGIAFVEIPPTPAGYAFVACLTHDVDHPSIRKHRFDHTMFGFIYRAVIGSILGVLRRRLPIHHLITNLVAVAKLPLVHLRLAEDYWLNFDRYLDIEKGLNSTFFVLPFRDAPGSAAGGMAPPKRASRYAAADLAVHLQRLVSAGREIGLHGIDAWNNSSIGRKEREEVARITGAEEIGVRMHWLYYDGEAPVTLENAGFVYDSTVGYNETVGYRAGTAQVFKPLSATRLLELPLHIMDTALFYPSHLNLTFEQARHRVSALIKEMLKYGGVLTLNWHDRSIAPERLWGEFYSDLVSDLRAKGAWCTSGGRVVRWFRKRRSIVFKQNAQFIEIAMPNASEASGDGLPELKVRRYNRRRTDLGSSCVFIDAAFTGTARISLSKDWSLACQ